MIDKLIFRSAVKRPKEERRSFVRAVCGKGGILRESVESMIKSHDECAGNCGGETISVVLNRHQKDLLSGRGSLIVPPLRAVRKVDATAQVAQGE